DNSRAPAVPQAPPQAQLMTAFIHKRPSVGTALTRPAVATTGIADKSEVMVPWARMEGRAAPEAPASRQVTYWISTFPIQIPMHTSTLQMEATEARAVAEGKEGRVAMEAWAAMEVTELLVAASLVVEELPAREVTAESVEEVDRVVLEAVLAGVEELLGYLYRGIPLDLLEPRPTVVAPPGWVEIRGFQE